MRKITSLLGVVALLAFIQAVFPNVSYGLIELAFGSGKTLSASDVASLLPKVADKDKPGFPHVNYDDPTSALRADANSPSVATIAGTAADFDSDGVQDLVTVDAGGKITFLKGNADTIYPNSPEAKLRRAEVGEATAFASARLAQSLPVSPDFFSAGDFNADGKSDILAAARGTSIIYLLAGQGDGRFSPPHSITIEGQITALETGEIGRPDGQTDIAVAYVNKGKSLVGVYEHPEGAFARKPEAFSLPSSASALAIGNLDKDPYGDVAAAGGSLLTLIHGRGQAYPLDMKANLDIQRPSAFVQSRQMSFAIADVSIGRFGKERGESIAVLSSDGRITVFEPQRNEVVVTTNKLTRDEIRQTGATSMRPVDADTGNYGVIKNEFPKTEAEADERGQLMADASAIKEDREKVFSDKFAALQKESAKLTPAERAKKLSDDIQKTLDTNARRKTAFEATLAPKAVPFSKFRIETIAADPAIAATASNGRPNSLIKGRFSDSGLDDLAVVDQFTNRIHIIGKWREANSKQQTGKANVVSIDAHQGSTAIVPMRLNTDGLSDLVLLGHGAPTVLMSRPTATFEVNTADDGGGDCVTPGSICTLRRALFLANVIGSGTVAITFNIPGSGVHTIHPMSQLEDVRRTMTIDGTTQPGYGGFPLIEIEGDLMAGGAHEGLKIRASNSVVRGLAINHFTSFEDDNGSQIGGSGITILSTNFSPNVNNVIVESNYLGTDPTGEIKKPNDANGVHIFDADANTIGGTFPLQRNILSGNGNFAENKQGVGLAITGGHNNFIYGNYIGTNAFGNLKVGNSYGVFFTGINNRFGGDNFGEGNVVSGNGGPPNQFGYCQGGGIYLVGLISLDDGSLQTDANVLKGNKIGTNASGTGPLGNCTVGMSSPADVNTTIGSITQTGRNIIADNGWDALWCGYASQSTFGISGACYIIGNNIGTDITGNVEIGNDQRNNSCVGFCIITDTVWVTPGDLAFVIVGSPGGTSPGGDCTGMCNLISGNDNDGFGGGGLYRSGYGFVFAVNNYLGVNRSGTAAMPNRQGFNSYYGSYVFGAELGDGNGGTVDGGNIASGNDQSGVSTTHIEGGGIFEIRGNLVGLSADGISSIGNGVGGTTSCGVCARSLGGTSAAIGGIGNLQRNYIAAETSDPFYNGTRGTGLNISTSVGASSTVFNNWIGLNKSGNLAGNSGNGIEVGGDGRTKIGGYNPGEMNFIFGNGRAGVVVSQFTHPQTGISPAKNVTIARNGIGVNGGLGIDLVEASLGDPYPTGVSPNDCFDADDGPNGYQNFPELFPYVINGNGTVSIPTTFRSVPARQFTIDYYQSPAADPSTYGEGSNYIGSVNVQTDGNGFAGFTFVSANPVIPTQLAFTATATDLFGNTSEFSCAAGVCNTGTFQEAMTNPEVSCIEPIIVTVDNNESDPNTADGFCDVDTNTAGLQCSLRAAIQEANARNGFDIINFDIPGAGVHTISIPAALRLPHITERVNINGTTQPGYNGTPLIEVSGIIEGDQLPGQGFVIETSRVEISGLAINRFAGNIFIGGAGLTTNDNFIYGCFIGMHPDGTVDTIAGQFGISIGGGTAKNNKIGAQYFEPNVIVNSAGAGILLAGTGVQNNIVANNKIGTDRAGTTAKPNASGILIGSGAKNNLIGGELEGEGNVISGNALNGISIGTNAEANKVTGNLIGTDVSGNFVLKNGMEGIKLISGAKLNIIGGPAAQRNIISGNGGGIDPARGFQVLIEATATQNEIYGNYIGLNKDGSAGLGGITGIGVAGNNNKIGGQQNSPNVIASQQVGIALGSGDPGLINSNQITYNRIGTDPSGTSPSANTFGILAIGTVINTSISNNLISGNQAGAILLRDGVTNTNISENKIGTDVNGNSAVKNLIGVAVIKSSSNRIINNQISGHSDGMGILFGDDLVQPPTSNINELMKQFTPLQRTEGVVYTSLNVVQGNRIGTDSVGTNPIPNGFGIVVGQNARDNQIGGKRSAGEGNVISGHTLPIGGTGIVLEPIFVVPTENFPQGNKVQGNRIGVRALSFLPLPNNVGIKLNGASLNTIGAEETSCSDPKDPCDPSDFGNIIGGNITDGVVVENPGSTANIIRHNFVGVAPDGTAIPNGGNGMTLKSPQDITVTENTIGNSGGNGILVEGNAPALNATGEPPVKRELGGFLVKISGNIIGLKIINGISKAPNVLAGIKLSNVTNVLIGDTVQNAPKNLISGNDGSGVVIEGQSSGNQINNSIIGTDGEGRLDLGNGGDGVKVVDSSNNMIGDNSGVAGRDATISGNVGNGVTIEGQGSQFNSVTSNSIGIFTAISNTIHRVPNLQNGILIRNGVNNIIGGLNLGLGNKVSGNTRSGILVSGGQATGNSVKFNQIGGILGTTFGNTIHGVHLTEGAQNNNIGDEDSGNSISGNGGSGIFVEDGEPAPLTEGTQSSQRNRLVGNTIFNNVGLGIDIFPTGANPNDPGDADEGPNRGQNYPVIDNFSIDGNGDLIVLYRLATSTANANYGTNGIYIQFFKSDLLGQGQTFLNNNFWTVSDQNASSLKSVNLGNAAALGFTLSDLMTATATDADGNTSEFVPTGAVPTPSPTPNSCVLINGGFESGNFSSWTVVDSEPTPVVSGAQALSGNFSAFLGSAMASQTPGDSSISQTITVPATGGTLSFWYRPETTDTIDFVWQDAYITDAAGTNVLATLLHVASNSQTWTQVTYDMSAFAGTTVAIKFLVHGDGFDLLTNMYIDNVCLSSISTSTPTNTPTPPPVVEGTVTYGNAIDAPAVRPVSDVLISAIGSTVSMSTFTGNDGAYSLSGFDTGAYTITPTKVGNQNNAITSFDAALISQHVIGPPFPQLTGNQLPVADVSGNGQLSSFDAAQIAHYVVGNTPTGNSGNWKFDPVSNFYAAITNSITGEDYAALLMGEVSGNWLDSGLRPTIGSESIEVKAPQVISQSQHDVIIPLQVRGITNKGIISYEFDLRYDPLVITPQPLAVDLTDTISRNLTAVVNAKTPGLLRVAVYGPAPIDENGILLNLRFMAVGRAGSVSQLIWERLLFNENIRPVSVTGRIELRANP